MRLRPFLFSRAHLRTSGMAAATAARSPTIAVRSSTMHAASSTGTTSLRRGWRCLVRGCRWAAGDSIRAGAASPSPVHKSPPCTVDHRGASRGVSRRGLRSNRGGGQILRPLPVHWKTRDFLHCPMGEIARFPMESPARIIKKSRLVRRLTERAGVSWWASGPAEAATSGPGHHEVPSRGDCPTGQV